jgi:hypothetical protein
MPEETKSNPDHPRPSAPHPRSSAFKKPPSRRACSEPVCRPSRRGGRRAGAGAPRGNMNALKSGAYSKQFALLGQLLAAEPKTRAVLLDLAARAGRKQAKANEFAAVLLTRYMDHVERIAARQSRGSRQRRSKREDRLILDLPVDDWDSIKETAARHEQNMTVLSLSKGRKEVFSPRINQTARTNPENQSIPTHETSID